MGDQRTVGSEGSMQIPGCVKGISRRGDAARLEEMVACLLPEYRPIERIEDGPCRPFQSVVSFLGAVKTVKCDGDSKVQPRCGFRRAHFINQMGESVKLNRIRLANGETIFDVSKARKYLSRKDWPGFHLPNAGLNDRLKLVPTSPKSQLHRPDRRFPLFDQCQVERAVDRSAEITPPPVDDGVAGFDARSGSGLSGLSVHNNRTALGPSMSSTGRPEQGERSRERARECARFVQRPDISDRHRSPR